MFLFLSLSGVFMGYRLWLFAESQEDSGRSRLEAIKAVVIYFPVHFFEL